MNTQRRNTGFTLIEILFVIAILGVITTLGLASFKQRAQEEKIQKIALQTQQLLQAGMAYYVDNGCWPNGKNCAKQPAPDFTPYIPVGNADNPWGSEYKYTDTTDHKKFDVISIVPSEAIAQRIYTVLPNAEVTKKAENQYQITAEVAIPGSGIAGDGGIHIAKIDTVSFNNFSEGSSTTPGQGGGIESSDPIQITCPAGQQVHMVVIPIAMQKAQTFQPDSSQATKHFSSNYAISYYTLNNATCDKENNCTIHLGVQAGYCDNPDQQHPYLCNNPLRYVKGVNSMTVQYIAYCELPKTK